MFSQQNLELISYTLALYAILALIGWWRHKSQPFHRPLWLNPLGIFVWGDAAPLGLFWLLLTLFLNFANALNWLPLSLTLFWSVRALGEIIFWLNEQFAQTHQNSPSNLPLHQYFPGKSIYFVYQVYWQCILVVTLLASVHQIITLAS